MRQDDDDIETGIMVRITGQTEAVAAATAYGGAVEGAASTTTDNGSIQGNTIDPSLFPPETPHGRSWGGDDASCRRNTDGIVDCQACLLAAKAALVQSLTSEGAVIVNHLLDELHTAAEEGLEKARIMASHNGISFQE